MLDNGTVMNGKLIEKPKGFQVACTVLTQIIAAVASEAYGASRVLLSLIRKIFEEVMTNITIIIRQTFLT